MLKLYKQINGDSIAIALEGDQENIIPEYYSFYNHEGTNGELHWVGPKFAYFYTDEQALKKCLVNKSLFKILNESPLKYKGKEAGAIKEAREMASKVYESIEHDDFLNLSIKTSGVVFATSENLEEMIDE